MRQSIGVDNLDRDDKDGISVVVLAQDKRAIGAGSGGGGVIAGPTGLSSTV